MPFGILVYVTVLNEELGQFAIPANVGPASALKAASLHLGQDPHSIHSYRGGVLLIVSNILYSLRNLVIRGEST
jgi:hypothetical protein